MASERQLPPERDLAQVQPTWWPNAEFEIRYLCPAAPERLKFRGVAEGLARRRAELLELDAITVTPADVRAAVAERKEGAGT